MWKATSHIQLPCPDALASTFATAKPFPHITIDHFLPESLASSLLTDFPAFDPRTARDEQGGASLKFTNEKVGEISSAYQELESALSSPAFLQWLSKVTGIPNLLFDPLHLGGGTHENLPGQDLAPHIDFNMHPRFGWFRRVNLLLYLNREWDEKWGGNLTLHSNPWKPRSQDSIVTIAPIWNRLAIFNTSESSWHSFDKVHQQKLPNFSRKSFAAYFYTESPPPHGLRFHHSTIYCERPMPESVKANSILSADDHAEVVRLTARRDQLLQFLYERELKFSELCLAQNEAIQNLKGQLKTAKIERDEFQDLAEHFKRDHAELLDAFSKKFSAMEADHQSLLKGFAQEMQTSKMEHSELALALEAQQKAARLNHENLLTAFKDKVAFFEAITRSDFLNVSGKKITLHKTGHQEFTIVNGSCNELSLWEGQKLLLKEEAEGTKASKPGEMLLVPLSCIAGKAAEPGQFTIVQKISDLGMSLILVRVFNDDQKLYLISAIDSLGIVSEKIDWFGQNSTLDFPMEFSFLQRQLARLSSFAFSSERAMPGIFSKKIVRKILAKIGLHLCIPA